MSRSKNQVDTRREIMRQVREGKINRKPDLSYVFKTIREPQVTPNTRHVTPKGHPLNLAQLLGIAPREDFEPEPLKKPIGQKANKPAVTVSPDDVPPVQAPEPVQEERVVNPDDDLFA